MESKKVEVTSTPATEEGLAEFMKGTEHHVGGQYDMEGRGMGSGMEPPAPPVEIQPPQEQMFVQEPVVGPEQNFQQMYGQEANEKGAHRRNAEEILAEFKNLKAENEALRQAFAAQQAVPQQPGYGYPTPPGPGMPPQAPQQPQPGQQLIDPAAAIPQSYFPDKDPSEQIEAGEVDQMLKSVAASVFQLHNQQVSMQQAQWQAQKATMGVTPVVEQQLTAENPWLMSLAEGPQKLQAMQSLLQRKQAEEARRAQAAQQQPGQPPVPVTQPAQVSPTQAAARRVTYIESGTGKVVDDSGQATLEQAKAELFNAKTAAEKKAVLMKYGVGESYDWGPDYLR